MPVLHDLSLRVARPRALSRRAKWAGKSTVLNAIYGFARVFAGSIVVSGSDTAKLAPSEKLKVARLAYVLQKDSVCPDMTVEENLLMGGYLRELPSEAKRAVEQVFDRHPKLKDRRHERARVLSGGERRLIEISRALIMDPELILTSLRSVSSRALSKPCSTRCANCVMSAARRSSWSSRMRAKVSSSPTSAMCWSGDAWSKPVTARSFSVTPRPECCFSAGD
jgi:predicted ABC-type transport system involved in lysophospholipase L1 biosynthesis ATPase subunit